MSAFLPEQSQNAPSGVTEFSPASPQTTTEDVALMQRVFSAAAQNPLMLPADFMAYLLDYVQTQRLIIPIGQVIGFTPYADATAANSAAISAAAVHAFGDNSGSLSVGAHVSGSAAGPAISGLLAGNYIFLASFDQSGMDGASLVFSTGLSVGGNPSMQIATLGSTTNVTSTITGTGGGAGGSISNCWLLAIRYSS